MTRLIISIVLGLVMAVLLHLVAILALPHASTQSAYTRLEELVPPNTVAALPAGSPQGDVIPFLDPAFSWGVCRFDLSAGPLHVKMPVSPTYTALTFYTWQGVAFYAINDRAAGRKLIELDLMTPAQKDDLPDDEEVTRADRLIIESPSSRGIITFKAMVAEPSLLPAAQASLQDARCLPLSQEKERG